MAENTDNRSLELLLYIRDTVDNLESVMLSIERKIDYAQDDIDKINERFVRIENKLGIQE